MPLDSSTYALALLRLDGRRWNELRRMHGQIRTQAAADGSSYLELGNTKVLCTVAGPAELRRSAQGAAAAGGGGGGGPGGGGDDAATITVDVNVAGFSGLDRKKRARNDKRTAELQHTIASTFASAVFTHLYPRSTIAIALHVLAQDGGVLAACINATTLALIDAGIPAQDFVVACTAGAITGIGEDDVADPLLDLNGSEEQELPFLTVATVGATDQVAALVLETRVPAGRVEGMLAVAVDGCKQVRGVLDGVVRRQGRRMVERAVT